MRVCYHRSWDIWSFLRQYQFGLSAICNGTFAVLHIPNFINFFRLITQPNYPSINDRMLSCSLNSRPIVEMATTMSLPRGVELMCSDLSTFVTRQQCVLKGRCTRPPIIVIWNHIWWQPSTRLASRRHVRKPNCRCMWDAKIAWRHLSLVIFGTELWDVCGRQWQKCSKIAVSPSALSPSRILLFI